MTHVFLSYKTEDRTRAVRVVRALERHGLSVWWDQSIPGGSEWNPAIEEALAAAGCVVVLWTHASVAPSASWIREESSRAKARGVLLPVRLDSVDPPFGFGEIQAIDLRHWRGSHRDPVFRDLVAAVHARLDGRPAPPARGPMIRLVRRLWLGSGLTVALGCGAVFGTNVLGVQDTICSLSDSVSDACGALGLGHRPRVEERLAWAARPPGNCDALRALQTRFPDGAWRERAAALLDGRRFERSQRFVAAPRTAQGYVRQGAIPFGKEADAKADALARAKEDASSILCKPRDPTERLAGVEVLPGTTDCRPDPRGGFVCGLDYEVHCRIERQPIAEVCDG